MQEELFPIYELGSKSRQASLVLEGGAHGLTALRPVAILTSAKSRLIAEYLGLFQKVTGGGLFIDGFAAPQDRQHEDAWTARRVLEIVPPRLRTLWLCDIDPGGVEQLRKLQTIHHGSPKSRRVIVLPGDFNKRVKEIIHSGRFTPRASIFALLDQRNTECHWATVRALACMRRRYKIELLYFLGTSWIHRSLTQSRLKGRLVQIDLWWGDQSWRDLPALSQAEIVKKMADRFASELGYRFVKPYPVYRTQDGVQATYYLIHASDHPEAPKLMDRAFRKIMGDAAKSPVDSQRHMFPELAEKPPAHVEAHRGSRSGSNL